MHNVTKGLWTVFPYIMQHQEVNLEALTDGQTMPKNDEMY